MWMNAISKILLKDNRKLQKEIHKLNMEIYKKERLIKLNESKIFKSCEHDWEYDTECGQYDRIKYKCKKCRLWKSNSMYS